jgi:hypothetical protein
LRNSALEITLSTAKRKKLLLSQLLLEHQLLALLQPLSQEVRRNLPFMP